MGLQQDSGAVDVHIRVLAHLVHGLAHARVGGQMHDDLAVAYELGDHRPVTDVIDYSSNRGSQYRRRLDATAVDLRMQTIEHNDVVLAVRQPVHQAGADESRASGHKYAAHLSQYPARMRTGAAAARNAVLPGPPSPLCERLGRTWFREPRPSLASISERASLDVALTA